MPWSAINFSSNLEVDGYTSGFAGSTNAQDDWTGDADSRPIVLQLSDLSGVSRFHSASGRGWARFSNAARMARPGSPRQRMMSQVEWRRGRTLERASTIIITQPPVGIRHWTYRHGDGESGETALVPRALRLVPSKSQSALNISAIWLEIFPSAGGRDPPMGLAGQ